MTELQQLSFFDYVKGKKIKWSGWGNTGKWFIPETFSTDNRGMLRGKSNISGTTFYISNGFQNINGWSMYYKQ